MSVSWSSQTSVGENPVGLCFLSGSTVQNVYKRHLLKMGDEFQKYRLQSQVKQMVYEVRRRYQHSEDHACGASVRDRSEQMLKNFETEGNSFGTSSGCGHPSHHQPLDNGVGLI